MSENPVSKMEWPCKVALYKLSLLLDAFKGPESDKIRIDINKSLDKFISMIISGLKPNENFFDIESKGSITQTISTSAEFIYFAERIVEFLRSDLRYTGDHVCRLVDNIKRFETDLMLKIKKSCVIITDATMEIQRETSRHDAVSLLELSMFSFKQLGVYRNFIIACIKTKDNFCKTLQSSLKGDELLKSTNKFDLVTNDYFERAAKSVESSFENLKKTAHTDLTKQREHVELMKSKIYELELQVNWVETWPHFGLEKINNTKKMFTQVQAYLKLYSENLDDQAVALAKEIEIATKKASEYARRLETEKDETASLLKEILLSENYSSWESLYGHRNKIGEFVSHFKSFWGFRKSTLDVLNESLGLIAKIIQSHISMSCAELLRLLQMKSDCVHVAKVLLTTHSADTRLILAYATSPKDAPLIQRITMSGFNNDIQSVLSLLCEGFVQLRDRPQDILRRKKVSEMAQLLRIWKDGEKSWDAYKSFLYYLNERHQILSAVIIDCPSYESLLKDTMTAALELQQEVKKSSLEFTCQNADTRLESLWKKADLLHAAMSLPMLKPHLNEEQQKNMEAIASQAVAHFEQEIQNIGSKLREFTSNFPTESHNFGLIYSSLANFDAIITALQDISLALTRIATDLKDESLQFMTSKLQEIAESLLSSAPEVDHLVEKIILYKRASREIPCLKREINKVIDGVLMKSAYSSGFLLEVSVALRSLNGDEGVIAQQILSEHKYFEGILNAVFNEATSGQDINYVIKGLQMQGLCAPEADVLNVMYASFHQLYTKLVMDGLQLLRQSEPNGTESSLKSLANAARDISKDFSMKYADQVCYITAYVFAFWSLSNCNFFVQNNALTKEYLMKPHAAQVTAIWLMRNCVHPKYQLLENRLVEVKTGEGKSIVLGVTAVILALFGFDTDVICYSEYLSSRDSKAFHKIFRAFEVQDHIWYGTIQKMPEKCFDFYRDGAKSAIEGFMKEEHHRRETRRRGVMLIDEVDVFFGGDVFGHQSRWCTKLNNQELTDLLLCVWKKCGYIGLDALLDSTEVQKTMKKYPNDVHEMISKEVKELCSEAKKVKDGRNKPYYISCDRIAYKYFDGLTTSRYCGYETIFAYVKEYEAGKITKNVMESTVGFLLTIADFSYAEFPFLYVVILGVTGTLTSLASDQRRVLEDIYNIRKYAHIPSVYGNNKLKFEAENSSDIIVSYTKEDHFLDIKHEIMRRQRSKNGNDEDSRAVMVFFYDRQTLLEFYDSNSMQGMRNTIRTITETAPLFEKESMFLKATERGAITLMIREYGHGTNFKVFDKKVITEGGIHVIGTFFSTDPSEEIQIKGRCARQGADGSFSMVLNAEDLRRDFQFSVKDMNNFKNCGKMYSSLNSERNTLEGKRIATMKTKVSKLEARHYQTIACKDAMKAGKKRREVINFFHELNGISRAESFTGSDIKKNILEEREVDLKKMSKEDKEKRSKAAKDIPFLEASKEEMLRLLVRNKLKEDEAIPAHKLLDVDANASADRILKAYRKLSLLFHPDKCKDEDASQIFIRLTEAKDRLLTV